MARKLLPLDHVLIPATAQKVFDGELFAVYQWAQEQFDGSTKTFEMLKRPDTMQIIVVQNNQVLLVDDTQPGRGTRRHFPGGRVDENEEWLAAAQRELREETGLTCSQWQLVHVAQPLNKIEWFTTVYVASDITQQQPPSTDEGGEKIIMHWQDFAATRSQIMSGELPALDHLQSFFSRITAVDQLLDLPECTGIEVNR